MVPASIAPTILIEPVQNRRDAFRNPLPKSEPPSLPPIIFPSAIILSSIFRAKPVKPPKRREKSTAIADGTSKAI